MMMKLALVFSLTTLAIALPNNLPSTVSAMCTPSTGCNNNLQCFVPHPNTTNGYCTPTVVSENAQCSQFAVCDLGLECKSFQTRVGSKSTCVKKPTSTTGYAAIDEPCGVEGTKLCAPNAVCAYQFTKRLICVAATAREGGLCGGKVPYPVACAQGLTCVKQDGTTRPGFCLQL
jgi:hypothetical protein